MSIAAIPTPEAAPCAVALEEVSVMRGGRAILRRLSAQFAAESVTALVGPSGAGKTTLVNVLNGLIEPDSGAVAASGIGALRGPAPWARMRRQTATIFQDHALIGRLSAFDNVLLGFAETRHPLSPFPWPRPTREAAARALADVGLLDRAFERVENFSGGERQRIGIARALARGPRLLLGDEPFSSLDPPLARRLGQDLRELTLRDGVTVVLVLHQIGLARALADRIVGLNNGSVVFDGPVAAFDAQAEARVFTHHFSLNKGN
jgi:phosphonate transport system ATP-binding protein